MLALRAGGLVLPGYPAPVPGVIVVDPDRGTVAEVGPDVREPAGSEVIVLEEAVIGPGLIDCHSHIGLVEMGGGDMGDDLNELTGPLMPQVRAIDGVNWYDPAFERAVSGGVTAVGVLPGPGNVVGGQAVAIHTWGRPGERVLKHPAGMKCALGELPKRAAGRRGGSPQTKMAAVALLRQSMCGGREYARGTASGGRAPGRRDLAAEAWIPVLNGDIPLRVHAYRAAEIEQALGVAREFGVRMVLEHAPESPRLADELAERNVPVVCNPYFTSPSRREQMAAGPDLPALLVSAGIAVAISTNHPEISAWSLRHAAGTSLRYGMSWRDAIAAITETPARILGINGVTGSLAAGKYADIVVWDGDPLDWRTKPLAVFIRGRRVWGGAGSAR
ncbi:MAG: amidohydrolase family protein [Firmicutes bacterium]|jgi:imidazolonepropionase-like amidohydrolase|nr:amidohydrolase family protein [Bacillota bacterium]